MIDSLQHAASLKTRITAIVLTLFVGGIGAFGFVTSQRLQSEFADVLANQQFSAATHAAAEIEQKIKLRHNALDLVGREITPELLGEPRRVQALLNARPLLGSLFGNGVVVIDKNGRAVAALPATVQRLSFDFNDTEYFRVAMATNRPTLGRPRIGRTSHAPGVGFSVPIRDAQGQPIGVLAGLANLSDPSLFGSIIDVPVGKSGWIAVNDGRYRLIIAINDPKRLLQPFPPMGVNRMLDRYADGYEGSGISINSQGREVLSSAKQIPGTGWFVQVVLPTSEAFEPIQDMKRRTYLLATAFTGLVAVLVWIAVRIVLRPLASSAQEIRSMAEGNTSLRELPVERNDEVGELLASFNTLFQQRKALEAELERQARTDALTGLPNRRYFLEVAASELARTARFGGELSVLILDLDHFKKVNDAHGHHAGDVALRHFAETCRAALREVDLVARFGGEEFVILLPETGTDAATDVAERLRQAVADMDVTVDENTVFRLTTSIGITTSTSPDDDIDTLLSLADSALYEAKAGGRNRVATRLRG